MDVPSSIMAPPTEVSKVEIRFKFLTEKFSLAEREMITVLYV